MLYVHKPLLSGLITFAWVSLCVISPANAHSVAGDRVFPATLGIDDPGVADELALPTFTYIPLNGDLCHETDISFNYAKRITENLALSIGDGYQQLHPGSSGWQNLSTALKYRFLTDGAHELMASVGLQASWEKTGSRNVADPFTTFTPNLYIGKGFGDLPKSLDWLRPFAITGQVGIDLPNQRRTGDDPNPNILNWGFTLQYSLPYLNANVQAIEGPEFLRHLVPIVEFAFQRPVSNAAPGTTITTGTVQPGLIYVGKSYQVAVEALVPINAASGHRVGIKGELHFFLDDIFPNSLGKPIFK